MNITRNTPGSSAEAVPMWPHFADVYFITDGARIKIGWSGATEARRAGLGGSRLRTLRYFPGTTKDERALHGKFASLRLRGEWFRHDQEILDCIDLLESHRDQLKAQTTTISRVIGAEPAPQPPKIGGTRPQDIPRMAEAFHRWASTACCKWPGDLQAKSYLAWEAAHYRRDGNAIEVFVAEYGRHYDG